MDNEPNDTLETAEFLTFLTMTGGGSINEIISGETLDGQADPTDYFYFTHKAGLKQVRISVDLGMVQDTLDQGGVYGETQMLLISPVGVAAGDALTVKRVVGFDAYYNEWFAQKGTITTAESDAWIAWVNDSGNGAKAADLDYVNRAMDWVDKIQEADGINVDPYVLGQQIESQFNVPVYTSNGEKVRAAMLQIAALYKKWEQPLYLDAFTEAPLASSQVEAIWDTKGERTALSVSGMHLQTKATEFPMVKFEVPAIYINVKSEQGAQLPTSGNDKFKGTGGADSWDGLGGNDTLDGGKGNDTLWGNVGNDSILGGDGDDVLDGGPGKDTIDGGKGNDTIRGGSENDKLIGGAGRDWIDAFAGKDTIDAGDGNDTVLAGSGNDRVAAGDGNDFVNAEAGKDSVDGGGGKDTIVGGAGKDVLTGGSGNDVFYYMSAADSRGNAADTITDFDRNGNDRINLADIFDGTLKFRGAKDFTKAGQIHIEDVSGPDVLVQVNLDTNTATVELEIRLAGTAASLVKADDFFL